MAALFLNCRSYWHAYGYALRMNEGMTLYRAGAQHPQLNGVMWMGAGDLADKVALARRQLQGVPWHWWVGPDSDPATLETLLSQGGTRIGSAPVMVVPTDAVNEIAAPAELEIEQVQSPESMREWVTAYAPAMGVAASDIPLMTTVEQARTDAPGSLVRFAGRVDGKIVGVSELLIAHGVAGIYLVATLEAQRRRGVGAALTHAAIALARQRGFSLATLQATPVGQLLYRRMGFTQVATYDIVTMRS